jgi:xanthine dehydrogenase YagR molybdenum-binding subunit
MRVSQRPDAVLKVTGRAKYAADFALARPAYAVLVTSAITLGAIEALDLADEGCELTSRADEYYVAGVETTARIYDAPNIHTMVSVVRADRNTPGFMRSPFEVPYMFALESAMDEIAVALGMDPVELRRVNDTKRDPVNGCAFSSRSLMACFDTAAKAFEWAKRDPRPGSMRDGDWLIGLGCATACHPAWLGPATARVALMGDGHARVETAAHDVGTGAYTVIAQTAAQKLGLNLAIRASRQLRSRGGSITTASVCSAVAIACDKIRGRLAATQDHLSNNDDFTMQNGWLVWASGKSEMLTEVFARLGVGAIEEYGEFIPRGGAADDLAKLSGGHTRAPRKFGCRESPERSRRATSSIRKPREANSWAA